MLRELIRNSIHNCTMLWKYGLRLLHLAFVSIFIEPGKGVVPMVASVVQPVQQVMVQIPAGMAPGMQMQVQIPGRGCMMVQIPAGMAPGGRTTSTFFSIASGEYADVDDF